MPRAADGGDWLVQRELVEARHQVANVDVLRAWNVAAPPLLLVAHVQDREILAPRPAPLQLRDVDRLEALRGQPGRLPRRYAAVQIAPQLLVADADELGDRLASAIRVFEEQRHGLVEGQDPAHIDAELSVELDIEGARDVLAREDVARPAVDQRDAARQPVADRLWREQAAKQTFPEPLLELIAARFRLLGEPIRLKLLALIAVNERSVGELAEITGTSQPNVSKHLAALAQGGLVQRRKVGTTTIYTIADPSVFTLCDAVCMGLQEHFASQARVLGLPGRDG